MSGWVWRPALPAPSHFLRRLPPNQGAGTASCRRTRPARGAARLSRSSQSRTARSDYRVPLSARTRINRARVTGVPRSASIRRRRACARPRHCRRILRAVVAVQRVDAVSNAARALVLGRCLVFEQLRTVMSADRCPCRVSWLRTSATDTVRTGVPAVRTLTAASNADREALADSKRWRVSRTVIAAAADTLAPRTGCSARFITCRGDSTDVAGLEGLTGSSVNPPEL